MSAFFRIKKYSYADGAFHSLMVSLGETVAMIYLSTGIVSSTALGLLTTLPVTLGAFSQAFIPNYLKNKSVSSITIVFASLQIFGLILVAQSFQNNSVKVPLVLAGLGLYFIGGMTSGSPWQEWMARVVPEQLQNTFFAQRTAFVSLVMLLAYLFLGYFLEGKLTEAWVSRLLYVAAAFRAISIFLLVRQPKPEKKVEFAENPSKEWNYKEKDEQGLGIKILSLCALMFFFRVSVNFSSPFYAPYMLGELKLTIQELTLINSVPILTRAILARNWGTLLDAKRLYEGLIICFVGIALLPVMWTFSGSSGYLMFLQFNSGIFWSGFEIISILFVQRLFPHHIMQSTGYVFAAGAFGGVFGGVLAGSALDNGITYNTVFFLSSLGRGLSAIVFVWYLGKHQAFRIRELEIRASFGTVLSIRPSLDLVGRMILLPARMPQAFKKKKAPSSDKNAA